MTNEFKPQGLDESHSKQFSSDMDDPEILEGTLTRIRFKNDTGFVIGEYQDKDNNKFAAIGSIINPQVQMDYLLTGYWMDDPKWGEQFRFSNYESIIPVDENGIFKYIVRICKFVGAAVGNALIDKYGDQTLIIMKTDPDRIAMEIKGITLERAQEIQETLVNNEVNESVMVGLGVLLDVPGIRKTLQSDLIRDYKSKAADIIKQNPYILTEYNGVGFPLADRVALNIGFARDSIERKKAVVLHCLKDNMQEGSVWIHNHHLIQKINVLIQVPDPEDGIWELIDSGLVTRVMGGGLTEKGEFDVDDCFFAMAKASKDEFYIVKKLTMMAMGGPLWKD